MNGPLKKTVIFSGGRGRVSGGGGRRGRSKSSVALDSSQDEISASTLESEQSSLDPVSIKLEPEDETKEIEAEEGKKSGKVNGPKSKTWFPGSRNAK